MSEQTPPGDGLEWYARPKAKSTSDGREEEDQDPVYLPLSLVKLSVLCVCTLGLYQYYWFFKNWQLQLVPRGSRKNRYLLPGFRAAFSGLFCYPLLKHIGSVAQGANLGSLQAGWLTIAWLLLNVASRLPDPYWLVTYAGFVPLLFVQNVVNEINAAESPPIRPRGDFSVWELLACAIGLSVGMLALAGTLGVQFFPDLELDM